MKKILILITLLVIIFSGCTDDSVMKKAVYTDVKINSFVKVGYVEIEFPYVNSHIEPKNLVTVLDSNNKKLDCDMNFNNSKLILNGPFINNQTYIIKINGELVNDETFQISYDVDKKFVFKGGDSIISKPLSSKELKFYVYPDTKSIELYSTSFPYESDLKNLISVQDIITKEDIPIAINLSYSSVFVSGDFKKDRAYVVNIKGDYNSSKLFEFKSYPLTSENLDINTHFKDEKSAHFSIDFFTGRIFTKDIRKYLEFDDDIEYSFSIYNNRLDIYSNFKPNTTYNFKIKKGFEAGEYDVRDDLFGSVVFGDMDKNLKFGDYKSYVSSYTEAIDIQTVNLQEVNIEIVKVNPENLNYLTIFKNYYLKDKYYQSSEEFNNLGETIDKYKKAISFEKNKTITTQINFNDKLKHRNDGVYLVVAKGPDDIYLVDSKLIFKSDIGISTKISKNQMFVSLRSLASNEVISNADVEVYSSKNKLLFKDKTNKDGILDREFKNIAASEPSLVIVKKGTQSNFLNLNNAISEYDILNDQNLVQSDYESLVFMERSLIRPSDKVNMLVSVKDNKFKSLENKTIYLQFIDPTQKELYTEELLLNEAGIAEYEFTSYNDYKTGKYRINVLLGKEKIGYKEFYVEAFVPEKIEVKVDSNKDKLLADEEIELSVNSKYLFGTPAKGLKYDVEVMANEASYISSNFKSYNFSNKLEKDKKSISAGFKSSGTLDDNGSKEFKFTLHLDKTSKSMIQTSLIGTVYDDGRAVRKYKEINLFPFSSIVGLKNDFTGTVERDKPVTFSSVILDPLNDKKIDEIQRLNVKVYKLFYHYYAGDEIREIENYSINSNEQIKVIPKQSGTYYVSVETEDGQISSETFYASGWDYDPVNIKNKDAYKVSIKTDKEVYDINENIKLDIKSPILGKLLLTIEENGIIDYKLINLTSNTAMLSFPLNQSIKKGAYIKAQVIRSTDSDDEVFPYRVIGSKYVKIDQTDKKINVDINTKNLYKSGDVVEINLNSQTQNSYAVVSMVDSGILNIINEKATDAFGFFDKKQEDLVSLYDLYSNLQKINKLKVQGVAGDGVEKKRKKHNSPDAMNERVKPVSFWSKIIKLDENGDGVAKFKLPNFNGEVLIQAIVVSDAKIGSNFKKTIVKDDVIVKPTLPRFLIQGDNVILPVRVLNTTNEDKKIKLNLETTANLTSKNVDIETTVSKNDSALIEFNIKALKPGLSKVKFVANDGSEVYNSETSIYIKDSYDYEVVSKYGIVNANDSAKIEIIDNDSKKFNTSVKAFVTIDNSPLSKLNKSVKYLIGYPHGCAEQTSSKLFAMLMSEKFIDKNDTKLQNQRKTFIQAGINKLASMQTYEGKFTYWRGGSYVNEYASFYATYVLNLLNEKGFNVPKNVLNDALKAHSINADNHKNLDFFTVNASTSDVNWIYDRGAYGDTLTSIVSLAAAMKKRNYALETKILLQRANEYAKSYDMKRERSYYDYFYSPIKDIAASLYLYVTYFSDDLTDSFSSDLLRTLNEYIANDKLYSTQDKAFAMMALDACYKNLDFSDKKIDSTLTYENELISVSDKFYDEISVKQNDSLTIKNHGGVLNYIVDINKPKKLKVKRFISNNDSIYLTSSVINATGNEIDYSNINLGDKLFMKVTMKAYKTIQNVSVNIQIPSGLEIINPRLYKSNTQTFENINYSPDLEDYRDDRMLTYLTVDRSEKVFYIPLVATTKGEFEYPASFIEAMYDSRINSYYKPANTLIVK